MAKRTLAQKLEEIIDSGHSQKSVAEEIGCDISTIYRIRIGAIPDPRYSIGQQIDRMWQRSKRPAAA